MDNLIEIIQFVKNKFEFRGSLFFKHLLDFFWSEFSDILGGERVNELSEFGIKRLVEDSCNFLILKILEVNKLIPLVVREAVPVIQALKALSHLFPQVNAAFLLEHHHSGTLRLLDNGLLKREPLSVVTKAEGDGDS